MTRPTAGQPGEGGCAALRWAIAGAVALGLHAGAAWLMIGGAKPELPDGSGDAVAVELEPVEGRTAKADETQVAGPADEASQAAPAAATAQASRAAPQPPDEVAPSIAPPPASPLVQPRPAEPPPSGTPPDAVEPPPAPPPPPDPPPEAPRPAPPEPAAPASAASAASAAAEESAPAVQKLSAARQATWRGKLVPHLNRYRRFPPGLHAGTARVGFTVDGAGRVTAVAVVASSGDAALDAAARDLVWRASPFPPPPPGTAGRDLGFVVPIHYDARRP